MVPATQLQARTVRVEPCMGTVFTIDIRDRGDWHEPIAAVVDWLHSVDAVFSTYRSDSAVNRLDRGEVTLDDCPGDVREVLTLCTEVHLDSGDYFTARPAGRLDPSAMVKGWAIERAGDLLRSAGADNHAVSGGGDMQLTGEAAPGRGWRVGIADPHRRNAVVAVVVGSGIAVATSGTAERGAHITDPFTGRPAVESASVTVVGNHLTFADAYATAAFAMGHRSRDWVESLPGCEALGVRADGTTWQTGGFAGLTAGSERDSG